MGSAASVPRPSADITDGPLQDEVRKREDEIAQLLGEASDEAREQLRALLRDEFCADPTRWTPGFVPEWKEADAPPPVGNETPAAKPDAAAPVGVVSISSTSAVAFVMVAMAEADAMAEAEEMVEVEAMAVAEPPIDSKDKRSWNANDGAVRPTSNFGSSNEEGRAAQARGDHIFKPGDKIRQRWTGGKNAWRILKTFLARGAFGDVSHVINTQRGDRDEVMKSVRILGKSEAERRKQQSPLVDEVRMMMRVGGHVNVLQVLGCMLWENEVLTFLEYAGNNGRELSDIIAKRELTVVADATAAKCAAVLRGLLTLALQLARGLAHIHWHCVLHNDVRGAAARRAAGAAARGGGAQGRLSSLVACL